MGQLWFDLGGYVIIRVKGARLETFVNMANRQGITLRQVSRPVPDRLYCSVSITEFRRLRPIIKALHLAVEIRRRRGLPFLVNRLLGRRTLVFGIILVLVVLYLASGFIWFVNLEKVPADLRAQVQELVTRSGISPGVRKNVVDPRELERTLLTNLDSLAWATIEVRGTALFVEAVKRTSFEDSRDEPGHLVAAKSGVIESIITFQGLPVARKGQTVKAGDVLISGIIPVNTLLTPPESPNPLLGQAGEWGYLFADGLVEAVIWYEASATALYDAVSKDETGRQARGYRLSIGQANFTWGRKVSPYVEFHTNEQTWCQVLPWRCGEIALTRITYRELRNFPVVRDQDDARDEALRLARAKIKAELPPGAAILDEQVQLTSANGQVRVEILVSTRESIGVQSPVTVGEPPPPNWEGFVIND